MTVRALLTVALAFALLLLAPSSPVNAAILAPDDATELANTLAEASTEQGVCYGWNIDVSDYSGGGEDGPDVGSNLGPGKPLTPGAGGCDKYVILTGYVTYTSESSESDDSSSWSIESNLTRPPLTSELEDLGYGSGDLTGDKNDVTLINAVGALPALVADHGEAEALPFEASTQPANVQGAPTNGPGNDFVREYGVMLALFGLIFAGGLVWLAMSLTGITKHFNRGGSSSSAADA